MSCSVNRIYGLGSVALRMEGFTLIDFRESRKGKAVETEEGIMKENRGRDNIEHF